MDELAGEARHGPARVPHEERPVGGPARGVPDRRREDRLEGPRRAPRRPTDPGDPPRRRRRRGRLVQHRRHRARARPSRSTATARPRSSTASRTSAPARARWSRSSPPRSSGCRSRRSPSASATRALPYGPDSGGSTTTPSSAPTIRARGLPGQAEARRGRRAGVEGRPPSPSRSPAGGFRRRATRRTTLTWTEACKLLPEEGVSATADARREPRGRLEALHGRRAVRRGRGRHGDRQGPGRAGRRRPRLRPRRQRADDREPDPGRRHPGRLLRPLRGPRARPADRPHGQPERRAVQDRRRPGRARDRGDRSCPSGTASTTPTRSGIGEPATVPDGRRDRQRRLARHRRAHPAAPDHAGGRARRGRRGRGAKGRPGMKPFVLVHAALARRGRARERAKPDAELKAGGVDLLDRMKEGLDSPKTRRLDRRDPGPRPHRGRAARADRRARDARADRRRPGSAQASTRRSPTAAAGAATPQIRNMATLGGNLCQRPRCWYYRLEEFDCRKKGGTTASRRTARTASTRSSTRTCSAAACTPRPRARRCSPTARRSRSSRRRASGRFRSTSSSTGPTDDATRENTPRPGEIIEAVAIPAPAAGARSVYRKLKEKESFDWPLVETCVRADDLAAASIRDARVVLRLASRPMPVPLEGGRGGPRRARALARARAQGGRGGASRGAKPLSQNAYKVRLARVELERALKAGLRLSDRSGPRRRRSARPDAALRARPARRARGGSVSLPAPAHEDLARAGRLRPGRPAQSPSTAQYWCLRTMRPDGPDGDLALPEECTDERICFEAADGGGRG